MAPIAPQIKYPTPQQQHSTTMAATCVTRSDSTRTGHHPRITEAEAIEAAYSIPSLRVATERPGSLKNTPRETPPVSGHGRSMSHPFPSLFPAKERRQVDKSSGPTLFDAETRPNQSTTRNSSRMIGKVPDKEFVTGKCMTCDSTVRWPKELSVFRCTVCLTINDRTPVFGAWTVGDAPQPYASEATDRGVGSLTALPISITWTRALIEQCITAYLLDRLAHVEEPIESRTHPLNLPQELHSGVREVDEGELSNLNHVSSYMTDFYEDGNNLKICSKSNPRAYDPRTSNVSKQVSTSNGSSGKATLHQPPLQKIPQEQNEEKTKNIFKPLEEYIISSFASPDRINNSFITPGPGMASRVGGEDTERAMLNKLDGKNHQGFYCLPDLDAKTLLIGDVAENGSWWTGGGGLRKISERTRLYHKYSSAGGLVSGSDPSNLKSPRIDWAELDEWYGAILNAGNSWKLYLQDLVDLNAKEPLHRSFSEEEILNLDHNILEAQVHARRVLLKATESLLKRPGTSPKQPGDARFLLIILANPLLYPSYLSRQKQPEVSRSKSTGFGRETTSETEDAPGRFGLTSSLGSYHDYGTGNGQHSGIIKRILGLISNLPNTCHHHLVSWFSTFPESQFQRTAELVGRFVTYRLTRQHGSRQAVEKDPIESPDPIVFMSGQRNSAVLHATLGISGQHTKKPERGPKPLVYNDDWQIRAAARVMALLFSANYMGISSEIGTKVDSTTSAGDSIINRSSGRGNRHGQILATSSFYNTLLDYTDLIADFEAWEARRSKFAFCQYPFFLSIWAKIQIMEHDARRQMEIKAREAFFDSIMTQKNVNQYLVLKIHRECLVEDSLKGVSEVVGSGGEEIKKGLRIEFKGEEGIDAGGLRKEWFLLLVRDLFNPEHGMFVYDEDSHFCYFNPYSFETSDQFFLVGVVLGLAIYNSTILDVALPPFAFRKLLAAGPVAVLGATLHIKSSMNYNLEDLAELRPILANGLRQLLEYEGDVEGMFCRDFVAEVERYGQAVQVPLCPNGEKIPVTNSNRGEFVDLYIRYLLDIAVARQFEPFKRGFFTVCGGNALSLFRPEEIELLIRGSDEPLDIGSLQAVATYDNWGIHNAASAEPVVGWFWHTFQEASPKKQRKLLSFITGSDRIPAMGAASLVIKISCLGDDSPRFPVARTCFNTLSLYRYSSRYKLENMLWRAVNDSEGFGLK